MRTSPSHGENTSAGSAGDGTARGAPDLTRSCRTLPPRFQRVARTRADLRHGSRATVRSLYFRAGGRLSDRKSTRLNSSHTVISYAVFCLKKKKKKINIEVH